MFVHSCGRRCLLPFIRQKVLVTVHAAGVHYKMCLLPFIQQKVFVTVHTVGVCYRSYGRRCPLSIVGVRYRLYGIRCSLPFIR